MKKRSAPVLSETVRKIRGIIESSTDECLPPVRNLAGLCMVSPVTVIRAIAVLREEGVIEGGWGKGYSIAGKKTSSPKVTNYQKTGKVKAIARMLRNDINEGKYPTHQPLPSIKQLSAYYNVSYPSIKKILDMLCKENIIKRNGVRYHFFTSRIKPRPRIAIVAFGTGRNSVKIETERERNFYRLLSTAAMNHNVRLETVCCDDSLVEPQFYTPDDTPLEHFLRSKDICGIILSSYHMKDSAECLRKLLQYNIPISAWVEDHRIQKMIDRYSGNRKKLSFFDSSYSILPGLEVGRYLIGKGHKKIAYISPYHESPWSQNRLSGLKKAANSYPDVQIFPFVCNQFLNDYYFLMKVQEESSFDRNCSTRRIVKNLHPFLKNGISSIRFEHDTLLRDSLIFTECERLMKQALENSSITAWVCANDHVAVLITDYWNHCSVPLAQRPALMGFDNSFKSFERNISSYEFNAFGEVQLMLNHLLYPNSSHLLNNKPAVRLSGRIVERAG
ncbi:MAG: GntR family transcriptional regulator [Fibrobacter sp.]|nr:GntR family transcriptional regulator [Fibrobacter sp.]